MLHKKVIVKYFSLFSLFMILLTLLLAAGCAGPSGIQGLQGIQGEPGISINWVGSLAAAPASPQLNDAYYNTADAKSYVWDGDNWETLAQDGAQGPQGIQGIQGIQGVQGEQGYGFAALVVAAADSMDQDADYVCNGSDDQVEINAAIDALPANGGSVYLREGTYVVSESVIISKSNVALIGAGASTAIKIKDTKDADIEVIYASAKSNLLVKNLRIDGNKANQTTGTMTGISFSGIEHSKVINFWAGNLRDHGIYLHSSSNNNTIAGNTCGGTDWIGIYLHTTSNNTITGNTLQGNSTGIYLASSGINTVTGNTCVDNAVNGLILLASTNNTITGNTSRNNSHNGISFFSSSNDNTVASNTFQGNGQNGIFVDSSGRTTIVGNTSQGNGQNGIRIHYSSNNTVTGNSCQGNSQSSDNTYSGILVSSNSDYNNIQGNTIRRGTETNKQKWGIRIDSSSGDANLVANNDCYQAGVTAGISNVGTGTEFGAGNRNNNGTWSTTPN